MGTINFKFILKKYIFIFIFQNLILCEEEECQKKTPIKFGTECLAKYCSKSQFISGECKISNSLIKIQWLNDIILVGELNFRYFNFITSSKGEMIVYSVAYPNSVNRIYYGINSKGSPLFKDINDNEVFIIKKQAQTSGRFESETTILKVTGDTNENREYLISFGKDAAKTEIFDFSNYDYELKELSNSNNLNLNSDTYSGVLLSFTEDNKYCYIFGAIVKSTYKFILIKFYYTYDTSGNLKYNKITDTEFNSLDKKIANCALNNNDILVCIYVSTNSYYKLIFLNLNLQLKNETQLSIVSPESPTTFFKFFQLKDNINIFTYYRGIENDFPTLQLIQTEISESSFIANLKEEILVNQYLFNNSVTLTDIIKIRDDLVCLSGSSQNKEKLIISLINFYKEIKYNIRYYEIDFFNLYQHKFYREMKLYLYKKNIVLGFSCCYQIACNVSADPHYSSLIFFSYPNSTEGYLDIVSHLKKEENNEIILNIFDNIIIDNNIFGFVLYGIKINTIDNCGFNLISNKRDNAIIENDIISKNEIIQVELSENQYQILSCELTYTIIITEPDYEEYNKYANLIYYENDEDEKEFFSNYLYEGKDENFEILISQEITKNCGTENINCNLCLQNDKSQCLICKYDYTFNNNMKICKEMKTSLVDNSNEDNNDDDNIIECKIDDIIKGECPNIILNEEKFREIYKYIKYSILKDNYNQENIIIPTADVIFQLSTFEDQKKSNLNISSIDLKECEYTLKKTYKLNDEDRLIIFKIDIISEDKITTYVQYEIYNPKNFEKLNLTYCEETEIIINIPVKLDPETISLYDSLIQSGYNLFDTNDPFYNDICTPYKSENGTDLILLDRKNIVFYKNAGNLTLCQSGCKLSGYNSVNKKANCECSVNEEEEVPKLKEMKIKFDKNYISDSFLNTIKNSNFLVLKCYKLVFNINNISKNIGMIIMSIILIISIILIFIYFIKEKNKIKIFIESILKIKYFSKCLKNSNKNNKDNKDKKNKSKTFKEKNIKSQKKDKQIQNRERKKNNSMSSSISVYKINKNNNRKAPPKKKNKEEKEYLNLNINKDYSQSNLRLNIKKDFQKKLPDIGNKNNNLSKKNKVTENNNLSKKVNFSENFNISSKRNISFLKNKNKNWFDEFKSLKSYDFIKKKNEKLNDQELNTLKYEIAIEKDKRTYFQYYLSLLKKKHLILFTFFPIEDYNLLTIKITLFLISFSLSFTINGFFFSDETMHKINENNGGFGFLLQITQIIYSTIICNVINTILKRLSLSERNILEIKSEKDFIKANNKTKSIERYIRIKIIIFFILSTIFLLFFWYFISCFCIVYNNTQILLIEDTLFSFGLSMIYPLGLNLIPGLFRIPALRALNKNKACLYIFSRLVAII